VIQDERPVQKALSHPIYKLTFLMPGGLKRQMIQDAILFQRLDKKTFIATGRPNDTRRDGFGAG